MRQHRGKASYETDEHEFVLTAIVDGHTESQTHPYGSTVARETWFEVDDVSFELDGKPIMATELCDRFGKEIAEDLMSRAEADAISNDEGSEYYDERD